MPRALALVAVGGYGRGQLFPHSDVDVLVLLPGRLDAAGTAIRSSACSRTLWDIGLEIGPRVRTIDECEREMAGDVTVTHEPARASPDRRQPRRCIAPSRSASSTRSTCARSTRRKTLEQQQRHLKHHDAAYNLEPNVKESPGGLRDLQTVIWIARAAGLGRGWRELAQARAHHARRRRAPSRGTSG